MGVRNKRRDDIELVRLAQTGDVEAEHTLVQRYARLVSYLTKDLYMKGSAADDMYQEGMIGLLAAIRRFDPARNTTFHTFTERCVTHHCISASRGADRRKHSQMNDSEFFGALTDAEIDTAYNPSGQPVPTPEDQAVASDSAARIRLALRKALSEKERRVLALYLQGFPYADIAVELRTTPKAVDNALRRAKDKMGKVRLDMQ